MKKLAENKRRAVRTGLPAGIGARIGRSLLVWGLAAILALCAYTDLVRDPADNTGEALAAEETSPADAGQKTGQPGLGAGQEEAKPDSDAGQETGQPGSGSGQEADADQAEDADQAVRKRVALTFDDGPHPVYTEELLDGLKERGARATFFVIGENIPGREDLIRRMDAEGHLIGNHTYDHVKISDMDVESACQQIEKTSSLIREIVGYDTEYVRPPFGEWNKKLECSFVMIPVLWDVDPRDWTTGNVSDIVRRVLEDTEDGDIILLHDCYESSVQAALEIVDRLQEQEYEFVTVDELILE